MQSNNKTSSSDPVKDIRSQLGSLVLSNGATVNASLQRTTPPSLASSHHRPISPPAAPVSASSPGSLNFEQLKQLMTQKSDGATDKPISSPTSMNPITALMQQLQQREAATQSPAPQSSSTVTPKLKPAAAPSSMIPPPKSEQARMAREAAKAQEVLQKHHQKSAKETAAKSDAEPSQRRVVVPAAATAAVSHQNTSAKSSAPASKTTTTTTTTTSAATGASVSGTAGHSSEIAAAKAACGFVSQLFGDKVLIDNLDAPRPIIRTAPTLATGGRYIVVGDVHGCVDQLEALIEKVKYEQGKDCLIIIGDYVNKGPDSTGVVHACMRHGALGVLGNHDYTLLNCIARMRRRAFTSDELRDPVKRLAQEFPRDAECYLRALPHMIRIPAYNVLLVHAGLNIQASFEQQDVRDVMHVRRLEEVETHTAAHHKQKVIKYNSIYKGDAGEPWARLWKGPEHVIFGHDAYAGFQSHPFACGIDTGCVYGDALTCVVFSAETPKGAYFDVPGLPKHSNERLGLPPPDSDIYEQSDFERQIIRPTTRATPVTVGSTPGTIARPNFLAMPLPGDRPSVVPTSFNSPASLVRFATPATVAERNSATRDSVSVGAREVQCASLLALAVAGELAAIAVLLSIPSYDGALDRMLEEGTKDTTSQQAFWRPFVEHVLRAVAERAPAAGVLSQCETDALDYVFGVCDELPSICEDVKKQLLAVQARNDVLTLGSQKFVATLVKG